MNWYIKVSQSFRHLKDAMPRIRNNWSTPDYFDRPGNQLGNIPRSDFIKNVLTPYLVEIYPNIGKDNPYTNHMLFGLSKKLLGRDTGNRWRDEESEMIAQKVTKMIDQAVQLWGGPPGSRATERYQKLLDEIVLLLGNHYESNILPKDQPSMESDLEKQVEDHMKGIDLSPQQDKRRTAQNIGSMKDMRTML